MDEEREFYRLVMPLVHEQMHRRRVPPRVALFAAYLAPVAGAALAGVVVWTLIWLL